MALNTLISKTLESSINTARTVANDPRAFDRKLEERSYLRFEFFESNKDAPHVRYLLFYENPDIKESRRALHAKFQPISRNSTLLAYAGAESRTFSVSFKFTLPHILNYSDLLASNRNTKTRSKEEMRKQFFESFNFRGGEKVEALMGNAKDHDIYFLDLDRDYEEIGPQSFVNNFEAKGRVVRRENPRPEINDAIDYIMYWTNLIRVSVLNNAKNPVYGPPIIRLNHGILYQDIPCVATDYKIEYDTAHGADLRTLLPRIISFELNLQEIRVGDFGDFDVKKITKRDNSVGWEAMIGNVNTIDPVRRDIGYIQAQKK